MRIVGYEQQGRRSVGLLEGASIVPLGTVEEFYVDVPGALAGADQVAVRVPRDAVAAAPPVPVTAKVFCIGLNYRSHLQETGQPVPDSPTVFARWGSTLTADGATVPVPRNEPGLDWEGELAAVIGSRLLHSDAEQAERAVLGWTCFNDLSARLHQRSSSQWAVGKNADGSAPIGPVLVTGDELGDPYDLLLRTRVDGQLVQQATTSELVFRVGRVVADASDCITVMPGDVIATGTPGGVGSVRSPPVYLTSGSTVEVEIQHIGILRTHIGDGRTLSVPTEGRP